MREWLLPELHQGSFAAERSINQILQAAFDILNYERVRIPISIHLKNRLVKQVNQSPLLGTSVFGPDDVYSKLKAFKAALPRDNNGDMYVPRPICGQQLIVPM